MILAETFLNRRLNSPAPGFKSPAGMAFSFFQAQKINYKVGLDVWYPRVKPEYLATELQLARLHVTSLALFILE